VSVIEDIATWPAAPSAGGREDDNMPFVVVRDLVKHYVIGGGLRGTRTIKSVDGVSFDIRQGEVLGLVGESGCGKTTIARLLVRLTDPDRGAMMIGGRDLSKLHGEALRAFRPVVQLIFQDPFSSLDPRMTIGASLAAPLAQHGMGTPAERREAVRRMLGEVGLDPSFCDRLPRQCSGGQLQRAVIARALLLKPRFLICDEPTSALDASMRTQILNLLVDLKKRFSLTLLMITHDLRVVRYLCDRIAVMYLGQIVEMAEREALFANPAHPYTRALIAASMLETGSLRGGEFVRGEPPSAINLPSGCRFRSRCPLAQARCAAEPPALESVAPGRLVRCHFWQQAATGPVGARA
jgi:oligopeptide/dipeptide ABC transporter ATP-binding protein